MTLANDARKNNFLDLKILLHRAVVAAPRFQHLLPGATGPGQASKFAEEIHTAEPWHYRQKWS